MKHAEVRPAGAPLDVTDVADALDFYDLPTERAADIAAYLTERRTEGERLAREYNARQCIPIMYRALTESERVALQGADTHSDGWVFAIRSGMRGRLIDAGFARVVEDGTRWPPLVITDAGRQAARQHGTSGGRA